MEKNLFFLANKINVLCPLSQSADRLVHMHHGRVHGGETAARQCDTRVFAEL
jgi:hypothetical protein